MGDIPALKASGVVWPRKLILDGMNASKVT
jgi:hypothetical protein